MHFEAANGCFAVRDPCWKTRRRTCDTMTYKIFGLYPHFLHPQLLAHSCPNPLNFVRVESDKSVFCCVNKVTVGKHLRTEAGCQWNQPFD